MNAVPIFVAPPVETAKPGPNPMPGNGVRLTTNALGTTYGITPSSPNYRHPFRATLGAREMSFRAGLVDIFTPRIGDKPMTEATLKLDARKVNAAGESWAVLEVEPNADGVLTVDSRIEIVQLAEVLRHDEKIGRQPLAMILYKQGVPSRLLSIVTFNLRYERLKPADGGGAMRHFFL